MTGSLALLGGHDAGVGHLLDYIAHAAIWSAVSHVVRQLPGGWLLIVAVVAGVVIVRRFRPRSSRTRARSTSRWHRSRGQADRGVCECGCRHSARGSDSTTPAPLDGMGGRRWHRR